MTRGEEFLKRYGGFLAPLGAAYGWAMRAREFAYQRGIKRTEIPSLPVVSVGNLTLGGTGKTPTVLLLARQLLSVGRRPAIVSRGYRRTSPSQEPLLVSDGRQILRSPSESGDEPAMLARALPNVPVAVCAKRARAIALLADKNLADCVILDDGFQHLAVARSLDLVLLNRDPRRMRVFPAGFLREPPTALKRAHAVLLTSAMSEEEVESVRAWLSRAFPHLTQLRIFFEPAMLRPLCGDNVLPLSMLAGKRVLAFAGIAAPWRFFHDVQSLCLQAVPLTLPDHTAYNPTTIEAIHTMARERYCEVCVTTAKDAVKLEALAATLDLPCYVLEQEARVEPIAKLQELVLTALRL
ncbi:MAG: tetraacyldisaccharide 4'-kinase [Candidatus Sumerlaea chitinivorans]|nr:tetraacyldisaccharide 4'-kinase [Candidatus Sumerlaea chitinivorans]